MKIKDDFIKQSSIMMLAIGLVNFFNLLFHLFMVRNLSTVNYGILNSLFAMFMIVSIPAATIQTVITKFVSRFQISDQLGKARLLIRHLGKRISVTAVALFLIIIIISSWLTDFLQLPGNQFVVVLAALLGLAIVLPVFLGGLQGFQKFNFLGLNLIVGDGLKLILGVILVLAGFQVMGALSAFLTANLVQLFLAIILLRIFLKSNKNIENGGPYRIDLSEVYKFFYPVALTHFCFMMLTNNHIILVKHFFDPLDAGRYSVASMVGKMILFLPGAISLVMFPKTAKLHAEERSSIDVFKKSLLYSGLLCAAVGLVFISYPMLLVKLLSVKEVDAFIPLSRMFVVSMSCFALIYVIMLYNLSIHNLKFLNTLIVFLVLQVLLIWLFHNSLTQVLAIVTINACLLLGVNLWIIKWKTGTVQTK